MNTWKIQKWGDDMMRCYIEKRDGTQNLPGDRFEENGDYFFVYQGDKLIGAFDKSIVDSIVLTEKQEVRK